MKRREDSERVAARKVVELTKNNISHANSSSQKSRSTMFEIPCRVTRLMKVDGPRKAVFATAELLEKILLHLQPMNVIGAQRTCRQFRDIIQTSKKLQEYTFSRPPTYTTLCGIKTTRTLGVPSDEMIGRITATTKASDYRAIVAAVESHPLIVPLCAISSWIWYEETPVTTVILKFPKGSRPQGVESWRSMYITCPPVKEVKFSFDWSMARDRFAVSGERTIASESGVTLGDLLETVLNGSMNDIKRGFSSGRSHDNGFTSKHTKIIDLIESAEQEYACKVHLANFNTIALRDVIIPKANEWALLR